MWEYLLVKKYIEWPDCEDDTLQVKWAISWEKWEKDPNQTSIKPKQVHSISYFSKLNKTPNFSINYTIAPWPMQQVSDHICFVPSSLSYLHAEPKQEERSSHTKRGSSFTHCLFKKNSPSLSSLSSPRVHFSNALSHCSLYYIYI